MTPKPWRWAGRTRITGSPDGPARGEPAPAPTKTEPETETTIETRPGTETRPGSETRPGTGIRPGAGRLIDPEVPPDRLRELAAENATGALYLNGRSGGTVWLVRGRIEHVESVLTPGIEALLLRPTFPDERSWGELAASLRRGESAAAVAAAARLLETGPVSPVDAEILRRTALADAALAALGRPVPEATRTRARFRPGERHWYEPTCSFSVPEVLAEVDRRRSLLARTTLGVRPDRPVHRVPQLPLDRIRLTSTHWNIARLADGRSTPLDIAWMLGHGVFATTMAVHQLARLGVVSIDPGRPESRPPAMVPARHGMSFLPPRTS